MPAAATIKDVARLAGVGVGTASRVISGRGSVAPETAARVRQAIDALGFRPSSIARALSTRSLDLVGILVPGFQGLYYGPVLDAVSHELRAVGRHMVAANSGFQGDARGHTIEALALLRQRDCDGLIFASHEFSDADLRAVYASNPRIAILNRTVPGLEAVCFSSDHRLGGRLAAECLLRHGHRRVAVVSGPAHAPDNEWRVSSLTDALAAAGCPVPEAAIVHGNFVVDSGHRCALELMARRPALGFTAVFCANDVMAYGLISAFQAGGLNVPGDVSVIGYDDAELSAHFNPPLTTIEQPMHQVARQATRDLINRCYGLDLHVERDFPSRLVLRDSVRAIGPSLLPAATTTPAPTPEPAPEPAADRAARAPRRTARA